MNVTGKAQTVYAYARSLAGQDAKVAKPEPGAAWIQEKDIFHRHADLGQRPGVEYLVRNNDLNPLQHARDHTIGLFEVMNLG